MLLMVLPLLLLLLLQLLPVKLLVCRLRLRPRGQDGCHEVLLSRGRPA